MHSADLQHKIQTILALPEDFHEAGVLSKAVLQAILRHSSNLELLHSVETGSGKSTLLLSWLSRHHVAFTLEAYGAHPADSFLNVQSSDLLNSDSVEFILGPTQKTLPNHSFEKPIQLALIDGPHGFPFPQLEYYYLYPQLEENALLIIDDIQIPTIAQLNDFIAADEMFEPIETVATTSFFRRTSSPVFDPYSDGWWLQNFNQQTLTQQRGFRTKIYDQLEKSFGRGTADRVRGMYRRLFARGSI